MDLQHNCIFFNIHFKNMYRLLHKYGYLHYFRDLRNGISPKVIIVPFRRICPITCLDYGLCQVLSRWVTINFLIELVCAQC